MRGRQRVVLGSSSTIGTPSITTGEAKTSAARALRAGAARVIAYPMVASALEPEDEERLADFYHRVLGWAYPVRRGLATEEVAAVVEPWRERSLCLVTDDLDTTLDSVVRAGGTVYLPAGEADGQRFALFADPENNLVGVLELAPSPSAA